MRVGLQAYLLHSGQSYRSAGVSTYVRHLLTHLPQVRPDLEFVTFHGADGIPQAGSSAIVSPVPTVRAPVRILWEQLGLPLQARAQHLGVLHGLVNVTPFFSPVPTIVTVHDLAFLRHPERFNRAKVAYLRIAVRASVRRARHVIAVSESTRDDLVSLLDRDGDSISVVYPGVDTRFEALPDEDTETFRRRVFGGRPYLLHVGTLEPRKNIDVLIKAFDQLKRRRRLPHVLALVGSPGWMYQPLFSLVSALGRGDDVVFVGHVPADELPLWYNCADLFAYPSEYEGFGLPVIEAMACGAPTITTDSSSLTEISGGACLLVEPGSMESLQVALTRVLDNSELASEMRQIGVERAARFNWSRTAAETGAVYDRVWAETR